MNAQLLPATQVREGDLVLLALDWAGDSVLFEATADAFTYDEQVTLYDGPEGAGGSSWLAGTDEFVVVAR